jgi:hypothetical protein
MASPSPESPSKSDQGLQESTTTTTTTPPSTVMTPWERIPDIAYKTWLSDTPMTAEEYNAASLVDRRLLRSLYQHEHHHQKQQRRHTVGTSPSATGNSPVSTTNNETAMVPTPMNFWNPPSMLWPPFLQSTVLSQQATANGKTDDDVVKNTKRSLPATSAAAAAFNTSTNKRPKRCISCVESGDQARMEMATCCAGRGNRQLCAYSQNQQQQQQQQKQKQRQSPLSIPTMTTTAALTAMPSAKNARQCQICLVSGDPVRQAMAHFCSGRGGRKLCNLGKF